jgi:hypothetical protein
MTSEEIKMSVADVMQDDDIENLDSILRMLNHEDDSWRAARGREFTPVEVIGALGQLIFDGLVTPCADQPPLPGCCPIPDDQDWEETASNELWFHLEPAGREAVRQWWATEGSRKYPLQE